MKKFTNFNAWLGLQIGAHTHTTGSLTFHITQCSILESTLSNCNLWPEVSNKRWYCIFLIPYKPLSLRLLWLAASRGLIWMHKVFRFESDSEKSKTSSRLQISQIWGIVAFCSSLQLSMQSNHLELHFMAQNKPCAVQYSILHILKTGASLRWFWAKLIFSSILGKH